MSELFRRIAPGIAVAGVALGAVIGFDRVLRPATPSQAATSAAPTAPATPTPSPSAAPSSPDTGTQATTCDAATELTGDTVQTRWGPVRVVAKVKSDGTVCESEAVVWPDGDGRSVQINQYALPIIEQEVVSEGVAFDAVTGATVTSEGYRQSLQSILDQL